MRWRGNRHSSNVNDLRGMGAASGSVAGGGLLLRFLPIIYRVLGLKGTVLAVVVFLAYNFFTGGLDNFLGDSSQQTATPQSAKPIKQSAEEQELVNFVSVVLADTEETWHALFKQQGIQYKEPKLVLFRGAVRSACGLGQSAMGPFYCSADHKVYIDLSFYDELKTRYKAPGDFAQAYVLAHEVGHHVQALTGISKKVRAAKQKVSKTAVNRLSVKQELQADCFAGIWAHHAQKTRNVLEVGDMDEALTAASAIGDDRLQKKATGHITPDSFTHGTSEQRIRWFKLGYTKGTIADCNTFSAKAL